MAQDVAGDGSTDRYIFNTPNKDGVRTFTLVDSYGSYCETDGPRTGAPLTTHGYASLEGTSGSPSRSWGSTWSMNSFLQPEPGTSAVDHLAGGLIPLAALAIAAANF